MKLLLHPIPRRRKGATRLRTRKQGGDRRPSLINPLAQQGVEECQDQCDASYDDPMEQLECYKRECWS